MVEKIRRAVTGHDQDGKSIFIIDANATAVKEMESMPGLALTDIWVTGDAPANNEGDADAADRPIILEPPKNGTIFRVVEFPPDTAWRDPQTHRRLSNQSAQDTRERPVGGRPHDAQNIHGRLSNCP